MSDIRACLQRLVEIWDEPNLRHEMPGAMWKAKEALKASESPKETCRECDDTGEWYGNLNIACGCPAGKTFVPRPEG